MMQKTEIWKPIKGYEGYYEISNLGRIKSLSRITPHGHRRKERFLKPGANKQGYYHVTLNMNDVHKIIDVHKLVAEAFVPNPNRLPQINHIDEIKANNKAINLEWCTNRYNQNYSQNKKAVSKYPGVTWHKRDMIWESHCHFNGKTKYLGRYKNEESAAQAYICFCAIHNLK